MLDYESVLNYSLYLKEFKEIITTHLYQNDREIIRKQLDIGFLKNEKYVLDEQTFINSLNDFTSNKNLYDVTKNLISEIIEKYNEKNYYSTLINQILILLKLNSTYELLIKKNVFIFWCLIWNNILDYPDIKKSILE